MLLLPLSLSKAVPLLELQKLQVFCWTYTFGTICCSLLGKLSLLHNEGFSELPCSLNYFTWSSYGVMSYVSSWSRGCISTNKQLCNTLCFAEAKLWWRWPHFKSTFKEYFEIQKHAPFIKVRRASPACSIWCVPVNHVPCQFVPKKSFN